MVPPIRNEAPLSDPDRSRPAVPDPQQDRHVSFPDDASSQGSPEGPTSFGSDLPPEAWAPRPTTRDSSSTASPTRRAPTATAPSILTTSPVPQPRRGRRRWPALLLVPLLFGIAHNGSSGNLTDGCTTYADGSSSVPGCGSFDGTGDGVSGLGAEQGVVGVWADDVTDSTKPLAPLLKGSPKVSPVPADATLLRVEVVSSGDASNSPPQTQIDTSANDFPIEGWGQGTPHAIDLHLDERPTSINVSVNVTSGTGTVQCRIYAGSTLVALETSAKSATCSPAL